MRAIVWHGKEDVTRLRSGSQMTIQSAWMLGAGRVIAIDWVPERLRLAEEKGKAETINFMETDAYDRLMEMTNGRGPDRCVDAVGAEAHGRGSFDAVLDKAKATVMLATDRAHVLRQTIMCCRKGGTISVPGVHVGAADKIPVGAAMHKGLTSSWARLTCSVTPSRFSRRSRAERLIHPLLSRTGVHSRTHRRCIRRSATKKMAASRSY